MTYKMKFHYTVRKVNKYSLNYVVGWQSRSFLTGFLQYMAKNMALLVKKLGGEFCFCQKALVF